MTTTDETTEIQGTDIHTWFSLSYCNYLVLHRTLLQSMPRDWQVRFTAMLDELDAAFAHVERPSYFKVEAAEQHEVGCLTDEQLARLGITRHEEPCTVKHDHDEAWGANCNGEITWADADRDDMTADELVLVPCADPVPHYNRGRAFIEPRLPDPLAGSSIEIECPSCNTDDPADFRNGCEDPWHAEMTAVLAGDDDQ